MVRPFTCQRCCLGRTRSGRTCELVGGQSIDRIGWRRRLGAAVAAPIGLPAKYRAGFHHRAGQIDSLWSRAPGGGPDPFPPSNGMAFQNRAGHQHVPVRGHSRRVSDEFDQLVAGFLRGRVGTGLIGSAGPVGFTSGDPRHPNSWPLGAPQGSVAIPNPGRRAGKVLARRNDGHFAAAVNRAAVVNRFFRSKSRLCRPGIDLMSKADRAEDSKSDRQPADKEQCP